MSRQASFLALSLALSFAMVLGTGWPHPPSLALCSGWMCDTGDDSVIPNPSLNLSRTL